MTIGDGTFASSTPGEAWGEPGQLAAALAALRGEIDAGAAGWGDRLGELAKASSRLRAGPSSGAAGSAWLNLLDELQALVASLEQQRAALIGQIRSLERHSLAGAAYRRHDRA